MEISKSSESNQVPYWNCKTQHVISTVASLQNLWIFLSTQIFLYTPKHKSCALHTISAHSITILHSKPDRTHSNPARVNPVQHRNQEVAMQVKPVILFTLSRCHCGHTKLKLALLFCSGFDTSKAPSFEATSPRRAASHPPQAACKAVGGILTESCNTYGRKRINYWH